MWCISCFASICLQVSKHSWRPHAAHGCVLVTTLLAGIEDGTAFIGTSQLDGSKRDIGTTTLLTSLSVGGSLGPDLMAFDGLDCG